MKEHGSLEKVLQFLKDKGDGEKIPKEFPYEEARKLFILKLHVKSIVHFAV